MLAKGCEVEHVSANRADEDAIRGVVARDRERFARLDVLVNIAGGGIGAAAADMSEFIKGTIPAEELLRTTDIAEALRFLLRVSPACVVPEIVFQRPGEVI